MHANHSLISTAANVEQRDIFRDENFSEQTRFKITTKLLTYQSVVDEMLTLYTEVVLRLRLGDDTTYTTVMRDFYCRIYDRHRATGGMRLLSFTVKTLENNMRKALWNESSARNITVDTMLARNVVQSKMKIDAGERILIKVNDTPFPLSKEYSLYLIDISVRYRNRAVPGCDVVLEDILDASRDMRDIVKEYFENDTKPLALQVINESRKAVAHIMGTEVVKATSVVTVSGVSLNPAIEFFVWFESVAVVIVFVSQVIELDYKLRNPDWNEYQLYKHYCIYMKSKQALADTIQTTVRRYKEIMKICFDAFDKAMSAVEFETPASTHIVRTYDSWLTNGIWSWRIVRDVLNRLGYVDKINDEYCDTPSSFARLHRVKIPLSRRSLNKAIEEAAAVQATEEELSTSAGAQTTFTEVPLDAFDLSPIKENESAYVIAMISLDDGEQPSKKQKTIDMSTCLRCNKPILSV